MNRAFDSRRENIRHARGCGVALTIAALLAILPTVAAADRLVEPYSSGDWVGGAYATDDGLDAYCALWKDFGSGAGIWLGIDKFGHFIEITDPEFLDVQTTEPFETALTIDAFRGMLFEATPETPDTLMIDLGTDPTIMQRLAAGERLILETWGIWYRLDGTAAAIGALEQCYLTYE